MKYGPYAKKAKSAYSKGRKAYKFGKKHQNTATKALVLAKKVARMVNVEYKHSYSSGSITPNSTGAVYNLFQPAQGSAYNQRDGDSIKVIRFDPTMVITKHASATFTYVRCIFFRGKAENGAIFGVSDWLQGDALSLKSVTEKFRTKTIYDKLFMLDSNNPSRTFKMDFKLFGHMKFSGGTTTIEDGGLYWLIISNEATNTPTCTFNHRMTFTDN